MSIVSAKRMMDYRQFVESLKSLVDLESRHDEEDIYRLEIFSDQFLNHEYYRRVLNTDLYPFSSPRDEYLDEIDPDLIRFFTLTYLLWYVTHFNYVKVLILTTEEDLGKVKEGLNSYVEHNELSPKTHDNGLAFDNGSEIHIICKDNVDEQSDTDYNIIQHHQLRFDRTVPPTVPWGMNKEDYKRLKNNNKEI